MSASSNESHTPPYTRYVLGLLTAVYVVNYVDRNLLAILLQSIKEDLQLSDSELGLLSGTAFGIFYATLGVPIARLADLFSRKWVIVGSLTLWSAMTALCGSAVGFASLLVCRIGVGIGEAGGSPPSHSIISDLYSDEKRGTALGIFSLGVPIGILVGLMAGGWLDEELGWRAAFWVVGLPGLLLSLLVTFTLREPNRGTTEASTVSEPIYSARDIVVYLWRLPSFRHTSIASALYAFVGYSVVNWAPSFLMRSYGMESGPIGTALSLIIGIGGGIGVYLGGSLSDRWALSDPRGRVYLPALAMLVSVPFSLLTYWVDTATASLALLALPSLLGLMYQGPAFAVTQTLATPLMRSTAAALLLFVINIIGLACGPALTGFLSDALEPSLGQESLRYALMATSLILPWSAYHFWAAGKTLAADIASAERQTRLEAQGLPLRE